MWYVLGSVYPNSFKIFMHADHVVGHNLKVEDELGTLAPLQYKSLPKARMSIRFLCDPFISSSNLNALRTARATSFLILLIC